MKTKHFRAAALALAIGLAATAHASDAPASRASIEALFQLMHTDTMFDTMYDAMQKSTAQMFAQDANKRGESAARQKIEAQAQADVLALVHSEFSGKALEAEMVDAYQKAFTEDEVTAMINFYSTPAGQAAITKAPQLMQNMMANMQTRMRALMPRMQAISEKANADAAAADAAH
jgi:hypothetical protein